MISNWFLAILLLFRIGGYTNYTQPTHHRKTINLVVSSKENSAKSITFADASIIKQDVNYNNLSTDYLQFISEQHSKIFCIRNNVFNHFIALSIAHKLLMHQNNTYTSEENPFHLGQHLFFLASQPLLKNIFQQLSL